MYNRQDYSFTTAKILMILYGSHQDMASLLFRGLGLSEVDQSLDDVMLEASLEDVLEDPLPPGAVLVILGPALGEVHQLLDVVLGQGLQRVLHQSFKKVHPKDRNHGEGPY